MSLLDFLFPKKCVGCRKFGEYLCANCFTSLSFSLSPKCLVCGKPSFNGMTHPVCKGKYAIDGYVAALSYKGIMKKLVYQFKYSPHLTDLQTTLTDLLYEQLIQDEVFHTALLTKPILIPIPLSKKKLQKRGYNQSEILAKNLGKRLNLEVKNLLQRDKETKPQYGLKREERMRNMKDAFRINSDIFRNSEIQKKTALVVDDVVTTGSTILEAAKVLKKNGFKKVWGVLLAQD